MTKATIIFSIQFDIETVTKFLSRLITCDHRKLIGDTIFASYKMRNVLYERTCVKFY